MDELPKIGADLSTRAGLSSLGEKARAQAAEARSAAERGESGEAAERFEALLATMLMRELRRSLPEGGFFKGTGADTFNGWMDEHLGRVLAETDALGLAGMVKASLAHKLEQQEESE